ncbi:hypothetical protein BN7_5294 [Wickerhamomyces ciferrii]|uniref:Alpha/beta hydrolase fold-3 domain-containing protein n=1 Tax=Wickerhamomyces ciferrii (strain ATCC 14091 / BCRC 22168 / CBS 111 / JCM 3599 / NBRC 0793 / NRRL Y-1031 F-60-10) TaxID=1206466 RepID=K0KW31_WICCF|nr:uncharacterized protein BN7_5294 [Wickerhamomyces ciferrii]CCH45709.1 hypothetical protein BN7_5294 [Wickerhamomyces ciferrii]
METLATNNWTAILVPRDVLVHRLFTNYYNQSTFSQRATLYEYCTVRYLHYNFQYFDLKTLAGAFCSEELSRWFLYFRTYRQSFAKLNDSKWEYVEEDNGVKGIWLTSVGRCATSDIDFVMFYVHGGGFIHSSPWFYVEYLNVFMIVLQEQGFKNPAIFIVDYQLKNFSNDLIALSKAWVYTRQKAPKAHLTLSGDGSGGLLAMSLLFHIASPYEFIPSGEIPLEKPSALFLTSPWTKLYYSDKTYPCTSDDFMNRNLLNQYSSSYIGETEFNVLKEQLETLEEANSSSSSSASLSLISHTVDQRSDHNHKINHYQNPILCDSMSLWKKSFPKYGALITYGDEEYLREEITMLSKKLSMCGKVKYEAQLNQIHDWPILTYYTERIEELREDGIHILAGIISRMLLWNTDSFFEDGALVPVDNEFT